ncbi:Vta1 like-domain-containing protein [Lactarius sanguifluus]|nr:Vta1 like-domain-containing protein [Lactarius sanguifluus]
MSYLGLPPIPPDLKPITPYVQRAHETRAQDPIISYWCILCGPQVGISLKVVGPLNRNFLAALLTMLESLRSTVGSSDAVNVESASSAYVENFALKVFASADNEDRRGAATRKTAKKFLAACHFFRTLFPEDPSNTLVFSPLPLNSHSTRKKYATPSGGLRRSPKPFGKVRQPTPVVGGAEATAEPVSALPDLHEGSSDVPNTHVDHELEGSYSASAPAPASVPPTFAGDRSAPEEHSAFSLNTSLGVPPKSSPVPIHGTTASHSIPAGSPSPPSLMKSSASKSRPHRDSKSSPSSSPRGSPTLGQGRGRNTSLGSSSLTSSPTTTAQRSTSPTHFIPRNSPPSTVPYLTGTPYASAPPPPPPPSVPYAPVPPPPPSLLGTSPPPELTPGLIAKAQKHCRFAISALDYEDAEQARKELRSALAILGG